ncbi:MAG: ABC transporter permease [Bacteroidales bacterium]|nr:ABC transporter permease [Bacteroidales bacterium]
MNKIGLIIKREFFSRVKKKSFIIMTILAPVLFAGLMIVPGIMATMGDKENKVIAVIDETNILDGVLKNDEHLSFEYIDNTSIGQIKQNFKESGYYAILYIPANILSLDQVQLYSDKQTTMGVNSHISANLGDFIEKLKLQKENVPLDILKRIKTNIKVKTIQWTSTGEEKQSSAGLASGIGYAAGFLIYFFIFMYGAQVMRGVMEEKSSRIVEVIISSVKPFQLMMGKVVGVALVGLTQFLLWIVLTLVLITGAKFILVGDKAPETAQQLTQNVMEANSDNPMQGASMTEFEKVFQELSGKIESVNFGLLIGSFLFYFLGGYLLYASLFAAIGSAVDNDTDTQQFMLPITIPLILGIFVMMNAMQAPNAPLAFWFSMIPLTSPIVMMVRIPFGVPAWELALSGTLLIAFFMGSIWLAAKIYRTGILMYGKKVNYAELWKWIRYRN